MTWDDNDYGESWFADDPAEDVVQTPEPKADGQNKTELKEEFVKSSTGTEHEFNGTLLIPTASEFERIAREHVTVDPICTASPQPLAPDFRGNRFARTRDDFKKVKMNYLDAARLRTRGV